MRATARMPCACGELVQGIIDGAYGLITCPIDVWAQATVELTPGGGVAGAMERGKARQAVELALRLLGERAGARLWVENPLPAGKGLGTSTADVVAAAAATAAAAGHRFSAAELARLAVQVEPSDGTFLPGIALFDHRQGLRQELLGPAPAVRILIADPGGVMDTVSFNQRQDLIELNRAKAGLVERAAALVRHGLQAGDAARVGEGATLSALANQAILPKPELEGILDISLREGALGVNVAHSGTVYGVLYQPGAVDAYALRHKLRQRYPYLRFTETALIGGGVEVIETPWPQAISATAGP